MVCYFAHFEQSLKGLRAHCSVLQPGVFTSVCADFISVKSPYPQGRLGDRRAIITVGRLDRTRISEHV